LRIERSADSLVRVDEWQDTNSAVNFSSSVPPTRTRLSALRSIWRLRVDLLVRLLILSVFAITMSARAAETATQTIPLDKAPPAVQKQIKSQVGGATLDEIEREEDNGEISYSVSFTRKNGEDSSLTVGEDGSLLGVEVQLKELPAAIQQTIKVQLGSGTLDSIEKTFDEGEVSYDVSFTRKDGVERSFSLDAKGALTSVQLGLEEVTAPVRKTIEEHSTQGKAGDIHKLIEDGEISYSAELQRDGKTRELIVSTDGKAESLQKFLDEVPQPVRKTIQEKVGSGKILRIDKSFVRLQGVEPFRVESRKDGKLFIFNVGPRGRYLGQEE